MTNRSNESTTGRLFKAALARMLDDGEFDKDWRHKKRVRKIRKALEAVKDAFEGGIAGAPLLVLMGIIDDAEVWQDIITYMVIAEHANAKARAAGEGDDAE